MNGEHGKDIKVRLDGVDLWPQSSNFCHLMSFTHLSLLSPSPFPSSHPSSGGAASPRDVILHNIDPMFKLKGKRHPGYAWDTRVRAALRSGDFKVITGNPGSGKWVKPPSEHEKGFHYGTLTSCGETARYLCVCSRFVYMPDEVYR